MESCRLLNPNFSRWSQLLISLTLHAKLNINMKPKNYIIIGVIIIAVALGVGYLVYQKTIPTLSTQNKVWPQQNEGQTIVDVTLSVNAAFSTATILIFNSGNIEYEARSPRTGIDKQTDLKRISQAEFVELANLINKNEFWSFDEKYLEENLADATTYTITIRSFPSSYNPALVFPGTYSVTCYGECPDGIAEIINKIKELWGKEILEVGV
jgi:hypothetical protein